jgi:hypothetical protein
MLKFDFDPLGIIPKDFLLDGKAKLLEYRMPAMPAFCDPKEIKIKVRLSYGGETTYGYLWILREYLNSLGSTLGN